MQTLVTRLRRASIAAASLLTATALLVLPSAAGAALPADAPWFHPFGAAGDDAAHDVAIDSSGNSYVAGVFSETGDFDPGLANWADRATTSPPGWRWTPPATPTSPGRSR